MMSHRTRKVRTGLACGMVTAVFFGVMALINTPSETRSAPEGTREDAAVAWYVGHTDAQRTTDCHTAWRTGDMIAVVEADRGEALRDTFRNAQQVIEWTARVGVADCQARGFGDVR